MGLGISQEAGPWPLDTSRVTAFQVLFVSQMPLTYRALKIAWWLMPFLKITAYKVLCGGEWLLKLDSLVVVVVVVLCVCLVFKPAPDPSSPFNHPVITVLPFALWSLWLLLGVLQWCLLGPPWCPLLSLGPWHIGTTALYLPVALLRGGEF